MRIVFMGTPEFAVASLELLIKNKYNIVGVVTVPDKPAGRGQLMHESAVKKYALQNNLKLLQPEKLKDENFITELKQLNADLQIVVAFRMLPEIVWNMPPLGTFNLHGSLLPKYRGAAPINWAIINGDTESGVSTFKLKHEIDTGNILFREKVQILEEDDAGDLHDKLKTVGAALILKTVNEIENSKIHKSELKFLPQNDSEATHAPKISKETCKINWNNSVEKIHNLIRGLSPYPAAFCSIKNNNQNLQVLKIFKSKFEIISHQKSNGLLIADKNSIKVFCTNGVLEILELQLEGKKRMSTSEFLKGYRLNESASLL